MGLEGARSQEGASQEGARQEGARHTGSGDTWPQHSQEPGQPGGAHLGETGKTYMRLFFVESLIDGRSCSSAA